LCETYQDQNEEMELEICLDDHHEIESALVVADNRLLECRVSEPSCVKADILQDVMAGKVDPNIFSQLRKLGLFYLESVFQYNFYRLDNENRTVAHYLAWCGHVAPLADVFAMVPAFANFQDIYGETPLMLAVRGGKGCISTLKFLLDLSAKSDLLLDICNEAGNTALHLAVNNQDVIAAELLVKHGADVSVKNINFQTPVDCIPLDLEDNKMKKLLSLLKI